MSTIRDLPNELLVNIFLWGTCIWAALDRHSLPFPVTASGVCSLWRNLALNAPSLWNYIVVPFFQPHIDAGTWTSYWIEKSRPYPIHIYLDLPETSSRFPGTNVVDASYSVITMIADNMARIRTLEITSVPFTSPSVLLGPLADTSAPILEQLNISFYGEMPSQVAFTGAKLLRESLKLSTVRLQGVTVLLPQTNLTHLTLHRALMLHEDMRCLFSTCLELSHLVLPELIYVHDISDHEIANINAPSLRYLAVSFSAGNITRPRSISLEYLIMPNVEYLEIDSGVFDSIALKRSLNPKKIRTLRLSNFTQDVFSVGESTHPNVKFVQSFINLEHLQLNRFLAVDNKEETLMSLMSNPRTESVNIRRRSISSLRQFHGPFESSSRTSPSTMSHIWPALITIAMDTIVAGQVARLCSFVATHPGVRDVKLSLSAKRHLAGSIKLTGPGSFRALSIRQKTEPLEAFEWLKSRVEVTDIDADDDGLIERSYQ